MVTLRGCWEMRDERVIETTGGFLGSVLLDTAGLGGICSLGARPGGMVPGQHVPHLQII